MSVLVILVLGLIKMIAIVTLTVTGATDKSQFKMSIRIIAVTTLNNTKQTELVAVKITLVQIEEINLLITEVQLVK